MPAKDDHGIPLGDHFFRVRIKNEALFIVFEGNHRDACLFSDMESPSRLILKFFL